MERMRARAQASTIRLKLLKIGAVVLRNTRKVRRLLSIHSQTSNRSGHDLGVHQIPVLSIEHYTKRPKSKRWRGTGIVQTISRNSSFGLLKKNWRQPTLAEAIQPLPSARLCLTAVFGMGTGRTTALWPPKIDKEQPARYRAGPNQFSLSLKTTHRNTGTTIRELKSYFLFRCKLASAVTKKIKIKPHDRLVLVN